MRKNISAGSTIVTAGATYLDIDAYACMIALVELLRLQGAEAVAWSNAPCNYSVCPALYLPCSAICRLDSLTFFDRSLE